MKKTRSHFVCPESKKPLFLVRDSRSKEPIRLEADKGNRYPFVNEIPDLTWPQTLSPQDDATRAFYDARADVYDRFLPLTFKTHRVNEKKTRESFIRQLGLKEGMRVLEIACGTGRDSEYIAQKLGSKGELHLQDISPLMLERCRTRLKKCPPRTEFSLSNATFLPFPNDYFDAVYSFGALGEFSDIQKSLSEMVRVARLGAKIVVGDESIPPWLRETDFAKILTTTNPQFAAPLPLNDIPIDARDVCVRWVIGGVFYLIDFSVGEGEPDADFDFEIPGPRGGTYRTRFEGQLEGVTPEAKQLAIESAAKSGLSMHAWLDKAVRDAAQKDHGST